MKLKRAVVLASSMMFGATHVCIGQTPYKLAEPGEQEKSAKVSNKARITMAFDNISMRDVIFAIANHGGYSVVFDDHDPALKKVLAERVRLQFDNLLVQDALTRAMQGTGYSAKLVGADRGIVLTKDVQASESKDRKIAGEITGQVLDSATQKGLEGVKVTVVGTRLIAVTGAHGEFRIPNTLEGNHTIEFKLVGYKLQSRTLVLTNGTAPPFRITLVAMATRLSDVVTTATGRQNRLEIGSAVTSINVDSVLRIAPVKTVTDLLETRVPGLTVQRSSGQPGDPSRLRIRGASSINGSNDPVVYVDGIRLYTEASMNVSAAMGASANYSAPAGLDQINPNEIETIDVFKGPSATAMFGSDAANGVIVITTKRGKAGPTQWSVSMNSGLSYVPGKYPESIFAYASIQGMFDVILSGFSYAGVLQNGGKIDSIFRYQALDDKRYTPFGRGSDQGVTTTVSGGTQKLQYRVTASGSNDIGVLRMPQSISTQYHEVYGKTQPGWMKRPDQYKTWNGGGAFTVFISPALRLALNSTLSNTDRRHSALGNNIIEVFMTLPPDSMVAANLNKFYERNTNATLTANNIASLDWQIVPSIPFNITTGISTVNRTDESLLPRGILNTSFFDGSNADSAGKYAIGQSTINTRTMNTRTRIPVGFPQLTLGLGTNLEWQSIRQVSASVTSLPPGVSEPQSGLIATQTTSSRTIFGWYLQPQFDFKSRFFIIPGFRIDNTSLSGSNAKFMRLPKMQVSWLVSDEPAFPLKSLFSELRLRGSFGVSGTQPNSNDGLRLLTLDTLAWTPEMYRYGATLNTLGNTQLRPESSKEIEGGFDASFWGGRLSVEVTGYQKTRTDAIVNAPLGYSVSIKDLAPTNARNIGVVRNSGIELALSGMLFESPRLGWSHALSFSRNANRVVRLNAGQEPITILPDGSGDSETRIVPGYPIYGRWARTMAGFADANGDGIIVPDEVVLNDSAVYIGQQLPTIGATYNSTLSLLQGRVSLSATLYYSGGALQTNHAMNGFYTSLMAVDSTLSLERQAKNIAQGLTGFSEKVSTLRFQTFSVNYQVPLSIAQRFRSRAMLISLQGSNLGLKTNYSGKDPNVNSDLLGNSTEDRGTLAEPRRWSLRITLNN